MEVNIADLTWAFFIYPRGEKSEETIRAYVEALKIGAKFPPIKIQRVFNYPKDDKKISAILILDGIHRWFAFKECGFKKIAAIQWKKEPLDYETNQTALLLEGVKCNIKHGDRLSSKDKKEIARNIAASDTKCRWTENALGEKLGVTHQMVNIWISDIRARQRASREVTIIRLNLLGWTQDEIAEKINLSQNRVSEIIGNANFCEIDTLLTQGRKMDYIAKHYHMDLVLAWALHLQEKTDQDKFKELGWGLRTWDQWNFNECDQRFGDDWPGRIPAQLVAHTLFYFTNPGDLIFDPMAVGCVVSDVCLVFERRCQSFDLATRNNRPEARYHYWELRGMQWPEIKKPDLIFFDPPYYTKKEKEYKKKATDITPSISSFSKEEYKEFFKSFFKLAHQNVKKETIIAFLNADWRDFQSTPASKENPDNSITIFDYHRILSETGWKVTHRIECPLSSERMSGGEVKKMQEKRILGTVERSLIILGKDKLTILRYLKAESGAIYPNHYLGNRHNQH